MNIKKSILFEAMKVKMPSTVTIATQGLEVLASKRNLTPDSIKSNFSDLLEELEKECYSIYLNVEDRLGEIVVREYIMQSGINPIFKELNKFFLSLSQSRKSRAGDTFEASITAFLRKCGYPFDEQPIINGKPDFVLPSKEHYQRNAPDSIVLTAKRTLRERWRQIATEGTRGKKALFLATLDDGQSEHQLLEMLSNGIFIVVPRKIKANNEAYFKSLNVISFEDFFTDHLDPAMTRWRRNKII